MPVQARGLREKGPTLEGWKVMPCGRLSPDVSSGHRHGVSCVSPAPEPMLGGIAVGGPTLLALGMPRSHGPCVPQVPPHPGANCPGLGHFSPRQRAPPPFLGRQRAIQRVWSLSGASRARPARCPGVPRLSQKRSTSLYGRQRWGSWRPRHGRRASPRGPAGGRAGANAPGPRRGTADAHALGARLRPVPKRGRGPGAGRAHHTTRSSH